jgi:hypothetical protein
MRVLTTGRVLVATALISASTAAVLALPASAGTTAPAAGHAGGTAATAAHGPGSAPGASAAVRTEGVSLGPAVKYVREPDGTVRQVR